MKVLFDHQIFSTQRYGGISRIFVEATCRFSNKITPIHSTRFSNNEYILHGESKIRKPFFASIDFKGKNRLIKLLNENFTKRFLAQREWDIFHPTYYHVDKETYALVKNKPVVTCLYDFIYEKYPHLFLSDELNAHIIYKKKILERADTIVAISENTKKDCVEIYGIDESKIKVIHLGCSDQIYDNQQRPIENPYFLYVGQRFGYKNFNNLVKAFSVFSKRNRNFRLICTGQAFNKQEIELLTQLGISEKCSASFYSDQELAQLYQYAEAFIFPSFYEGFGIPIIEAFKYSCPVILSDRSCFPEIAGDAALYFNPENIDSILSSLYEIQQKRDLLKEIGQKRLLSFSWDKFTASLENEYSKLMK